jgi:hypothetical protein
MRNRDPETMRNRDPEMKFNITLTTGGLLWIVMWSFTIAFSHLGFGNGIAALFAWPYFLGDALATLAGVR